MMYVFVVSIQVADDLNMKEGVEDGRRGSYPAQGPCKLHERENERKQKYYVFIFIHANYSNKLFF